MIKIFTEIFRPLREDKIKFSITFLLFIFSWHLHAQQISENLSKQYMPNVYWLTLRADYYLKSGSYFFVENNNRFTRDIPPIGLSFPFNKIYRMYFMGGYEHKASDHWYLGLSEKIVLIQGRNSFYSRVNVSHRGKLFKLRFIKELALEHIKYPHSNDPNVLVYNEGRVSTSLSLLKEWKLKDKRFYFLVAYRPYFLFYWVNAGINSNYNKRFIDKTRLRVEIACFLTRQLLVSVFAMRDTDYTYRLATYTAGSNGNMTLVSPETRLNRIFPTFGLTLNYVFGAPDDFIPGYPVK